MNAADIFGFLMVACFSVAYFPQAIKIIINKSAKDVSITEYAITSVGCLSALIYASLTNLTWWWAINQGSGILLCGWIIYLCHKYK